MLKCVKEYSLPTSRFFDAVFSLRKSLKLIYNNIINNTIENFTNHR